MPTFEQTNLQAFLNRLQSNTLTAADQAILAQSLAFCILNWGQGGISVDPNVGAGTDPAPVDDTWFAVLYNEALGLVSGGSLTPASWAQATWFIDPQNVTGVASDANTGLTAAAPLKTWAALQARWGTSSPVLRATVTVTFLSSHVDNTDPVVATPFLANGASFVLAGATLAATPAIFTLTTAKNRAAGTNALLTGSFSAGVPAPGLLVVNTTSGKSSRAFVYKNAGGANWNLTQPIVPFGVPPQAISPGAEVDTWANGDTVNLQPLVAVNVAVLRCTLVDYNAAFSNYAYLYNLTVFDPKGATIDDVYVSAHVALVECALQRNLVLDGASDASSFVLNSFNGGGLFAGQNTPATAGCPQIFGGCLASTALPSSVLGGVLLDSDFILGTLLTVAAGFVQLGMVFLDQNVTLLSGSTGVLQASAIPNPVLYGSAGHNISLVGSAHFANLSGTFTARFTAPALVTGILLNGTASGTGHSGANNPDVFNSAISTIPAHLDAAQGVAGFGSNAFNPGGASVSNFN